MSNDQIINSKQASEFFGGKFYDEIKVEEMLQLAREDEARKAKQKAIEFAKWTHSSAWHYHWLKENWTNPLSNHLLSTPELFDLFENSQTNNNKEG